MKRKYRVKKFFKDDSGAGLIDYSILVTLILCTALPSAHVFSIKLKKMWCGSLSHVNIDEDESTAQEAFEWIDGDNLCVLHDNSGQSMTPQTILF